jgi:hypothetical protein
MMVAQGLKMAYLTVVEAAVVLMQLVQPVLERGLVMVVMERLLQF